MASNDNREAPTAASDPSEEPGRDDSAVGRDLLPSVHTHEAPATRLEGQATQETEESSREQYDSGSIQDHEALAAASSYHDVSVAQAHENHPRGTLDSTVQASSALQGNSSILPSEACALWALSSPSTANMLTDSLLRRRKH